VVLLRLRTSASICCRIEIEEGSGRCASARERKRDQNRAVVLYAGDGFVLERLQHCGSPVRNRSGLVASRAGERKGDGGGGYGLLIAAGMRRLEWGVKELKRD
jgi:hypothetical protein